ncbi:hypothetical protein NGM99_00260 [Mesorhizobium sp. RP14(2022)]|uniref:Uncharacterized protein n=1 Tax=Mesorhizobium liriopis TaxID=2953882 RepID=A0ABT1C058_9HYPH|nr:hypothetical protein [Mesorhizobium liriopis]MCO6048221.1 hypothetical protein [Mesorhizobium liriopis]
MWICLNDSFVSAVQDINRPSRLMVRSRRRNHLERLFPDHEILTTIRSDYAHRVFVERDDFKRVLVDQVNLVTYSNFKDSVRDPVLHDLYLDFWMLHCSANSPRNINPYRGRHFAKSSRHLRHMF